MKKNLLALALLAAVLPLQAAEIPVATATDQTTYAFLDNTQRVEGNGSVSVVMSVREPGKNVTRYKLTVDGCAAKGGRYYINDDRSGGAGNYWTWNDDGDSAVIDGVATKLCRSLKRSM